MSSARNINSKTLSLILSTLNSRRKKKKRTEIIIDQCKHNEPSERYKKKKGITSKLRKWRNCSIEKLTFEVELEGQDKILKRRIGKNQHE